jgi:hypothetical protein
MFASHWPKVVSGDDTPFTDKLHAVPKIAISTRLKDVTVVHTIVGGRIFYPSGRPLAGDNAAR